MEKRGISDVIATILIILVVLVAVAIVWNVVKFIVSEKSENIAGGFQGLMLADLNVKRWADNTDGSINVTVSAGSGNSVSGIRYLVETSQTTCSFVQNDSINQLETKTFRVNVLGCSGTILKVSAQSVTGGGGGATLGTPSCTNDAGCSSAGNFCDGNLIYTCSLGSGGCLDRVNGDDCSLQGKTCSAGSCVSIPTTNSISQYGITWIFDKQYQYGQFANGDYWVVGPVNIISITPGNQTIHQVGHGPDADYIINGNMINPDPGGILYPNQPKQGYDQRNPSWNVSLSVDNDVTLWPNQSLVSTISWQFGEEGCPAANDFPQMPQPCLHYAAVLTCLGQAPSETFFRPPYAGNEKPLIPLSSLNISILPNLITVAGQPDINDIISSVNRSWIQHQTAEYGEYIRPSGNMPMAGKYVANAFNKASLMLMINISTSDKTELAKYLCQIGIDDYYILKGGGGWGANGGQMGAGHKWPILLTGLLLNNSELKNVGTTYAWPGLYFQEDCQTFYITQTDVNRFPPTNRTNCAITYDTYNGNTVAIITDSNGGSWWDNDAGGQQPIESGYGFPSDFVVRVNRSTGVYNIVRANAIHNGDNSKLRVNQAAWPYYGLLDTGTGLKVAIQLFPAYCIGFPDWGQWHAFNPIEDFYARGYRFDVGQTYAAADLSALILNAKGLWNHDAFFDFTDFFMAELPQGESHRGMSVFAENMWDTYRNKYGCIWTGDKLPNENSKWHYNCSGCLHNCLTSPYCGDGICNEAPSTCPWDCE